MKQAERGGSPRAFLSSSASPWPRPIRALRGQETAGAAAHGK